MRKILLLLLFVSSCGLYAQSNNSLFGKKEKLRELLTQHYKSDVQKQQAATFLINNIDIQNSQDYNWVDSNGKKVLYNELDYPNIEEAVKAFNKLKDSVKITPKPYKLMDIDVLTPELLIKNIDLAFDAWKNNPWSKSYDFNTFCEYILPYRSIVEPLEDWREEFKLLATNGIYGVHDKAAAIEVATNVISSLKDFKFLGSRPDPIPFLSPKQLLFRKEGACNDLANLAVLACRSVGIATTFDFTPYYGASSNKHYWNTFVTETGEHVPFNGNSYGSTGGLPYIYKPTTKRLAKVFRKTYSIQNSALASKYSKLSIPNGFLNDKNILDVTDEYVPVGEIRTPSLSANTEDIAYLNVFNMGKWNVTDWAFKETNFFSFRKLGANIVYLPSFYHADTKKMEYASYPILLDVNKKQQVLRPNFQKTFSFKITRDKNKETETRDFNSFEVFDGEVFALLVWDKTWKKVETAIAKNNAIAFTKIPENGLFLLLCKKSNGYERVFCINPKTEEIEWY